MVVSKVNAWWRARYREAPDVWPVFEDFKVFLALSWRHLSLPSPTPVQNDIANFLQHQRGDVSVLAFRGIGKSWICGCFVPWLLLRESALKALVVSASRSKAEELSTFMYRLVFEMPILQHLAPKGEDRDSKLAFDVADIPLAQAPSVRSAGIFGQLTGSRADIILSDDIEIPNTSDTVGMRAKLWDRFSEFPSILSPGGRNIVLGTPQTEGSLYHTLPDKGYTTRIWPARYPDKEWIKRLGSMLAPSILRRLQESKRTASGLSKDLEGKSTDPKRFSDEDLIKREIQLGPLKFRMQFMLDASLADADKYPLRLRDLIVVDIPPRHGYDGIWWGSDPALRLSDLPNVGLNGDYMVKPLLIDKSDSGTPLLRPFTASVMAIDPKGKGASELGYAVIKTLNGVVFLTASGAVPDFSEESLRKLALIAKEQSVNEIVCEENYGGGMFVALLRPVLGALYPCKVSEVWNSVQKERRIIETLEPVVRGHRLVVDRSLVQQDYESTRHLPVEKQDQYRLFYQFTRVTMERRSLNAIDPLGCASNGRAAFDARAQRG
uniref:Terminase large subunit ribonuclease H-like domain-containing protein n=1 Tax=Candidatus Kentrum sp. TC TaxID=2126339 RepID=A0A451A9N6_9GAMM|nr:MAG: hypothetical protein BECKTC1821F_GA0114240_10795 [Candidatus Kentron sp. TC]